MRVEKGEKEEKGKETFRMCRSRLVIDKETGVERLLLEL